MAARIRLATLSGTNLPLLFGRVVRPRYLWTTMARRSMTLAKGTGSVRGWWGPDPTQR